MEQNWLEWLGYLASLIVLISLLMSSIIKLRWINLLGSAIFSIYGFLIGAFPVGFMNLGISIINIYYLVKIYSSKEYFKIIPFESDSHYLKYFLEFYKNDISKYASVSTFEFKSMENSLNFYILRNVVPAGIFIGKQIDPTTLKIELDFAIPQYRDFKIGSYLYGKRKDLFIKSGYSKLICETKNAEHIKYLKKMGFNETVENGNSYLVKSVH